MMNSHRFVNFLSIMLVSVYVFAILGEFKLFHLWSQVEYIHNNGGLGLLDIFSHAHWLRYHLVLPVYSLSEILGVDSSIVFSFMCLGFIVFMSFVLTRLIALDMKVEPLQPFLLLGFLSFFILISMFMNGRLIFGFLSVSFLLVFLKFIGGVYNLYYGTLLMLFTGLLAGVSSGVFLSVISAMCLCVCIFLIIDLLNGRLKRHYLIYFSYLLVGLVFLPIALVMIGKNILFYNDGVVAMTAHGVINSELASPKNIVNGLPLLKAVWLIGGLVGVLYTIRLSFPRIKNKSYFSSYVSISAFVLLLLSVFAYSIVAISIVLVVFMLFSLGISYLKNSKFYSGFEIL